MKNEREIVEEKEETAGSRPCKRKRLTEVLKAPKPSPAKTDSCNPFHNRTQDRTNERENCTVLDLAPQKIESEQRRLHGLVSSTHTVLEKDHAQGDQPDCQS